MHSGYACELCCNALLCSSLLIYILRVLLLVMPAEACKVTIFKFLEFLSIKLTLFLIIQLLCRSLLVKHCCMRHISLFTQEDLQDYEIVTKPVPDQPPPTYENAAEEKTTTTKVEEAIYQKAENVYEEPDAIRVVEKKKEEPAKLDIAAAAASVPEVR